MRQLWYLFGDGNLGSEDVEVVGVIMSYLPPEVHHVLSGACALIFDLDGTLVDTHDAHERSWRKAFSAVGLSMSTSWYRQRTGLTANQLIDDMGVAHGKSIDATTVKTMELRCFLKEARKLAPIESVISIAEEFRDASHMAVASNGDANSVNATLAGAGISHLFSVIVTADDGLRPKPFPDAFLQAAERLGVKKECCLAFEDTGGGIAAAQAAGMKVVDVRTWEVF